MTAPPGLFTRARRATPAILVQEVFPSVPIESGNADNSLFLQNVKGFASAPLGSSRGFFPFGKNETLHFYLHKSNLHALFKFRGPCAGFRREIFRVRRREERASDKESHNAFLVAGKLQQVVQANRDSRISKRNHAAVVGGQYCKHA